MTEQIDPRSLQFASHFLSWLVVGSRLPEAAANRALVTQRETGERIDRVLTELGLLTSDDLIAALSDFLGIAVYDAASEPLDREALKNLTLGFAQRARLVPVRRGGSLAFASSDPFNADAIKAAQFELGSPFPLVIAGDSAIALMLEAASKTEGATAAAEAAHATASDILRLRESASEAPIVRTVHRIIADAVRARASDIHFDAYQSGLSIRYRLDGILVERERLQVDIATAVVSRLKIMAGLNIAENRLLQDGRILTAVDGRDAEFRMATTPVVHGESVVLRLLGRSSVDVDLVA